MTQEAEAVQQQEEKSLSYPTLYIIVGLAFSALLLFVPAAIPQVERLFMCIFACVLLGFYLLLMLLEDLLKAIEKSP